MIRPADTLVASAQAATPIILVNPANLEAWTADQSDATVEWLSRQRFNAQPGEFAWIENAGVASVVVGWSGDESLATLGHLARTLPEGCYACDTLSVQLALGWALGAYRFERYQDSDREPAQLLVADDAIRTKAQHITQAVCLTRDLVNTPAADMAPSHIEAEIHALGERFGATVTSTVGDALLDMEFGAIHAVGRAAADAPRLIELHWGNTSAPLVTLVGKGVTFDSGGLDIKPASGMRHMKKDMGGAATAIGLAQLIMAEALPIQLQLLIPAAENAISSNAFRPGDILNTRKGITVEIDNTDAEGRLLLCDALALAAEANPELVVDFATLTGSARSAVGAEIAAMFCDDDDIACALVAAGVKTEDDVWRMPLHKPYAYKLDSKVADIVNSAATPYAGAITAALFLQRFVGEHAWVHFDLMAYNNRARPGRPEGGEAMALRAVFQFLEQRYVNA